MKLKFKNIFAFCFLILSVSLYAQNDGNLIKTQPSEITIGTDIDEAEYEVPFSVSEEIPNFESCKDSVGQAAKDCFFLKINEHVAKNFKYPKEAKKANIQGKVFVIFTINKSGDTEGFKVKAPKNAKLLEEEALRIVKLLPKFIPGKQRGKPVNVQFALPINFVLEESVKDEKNK
jgi:TonB family protein